MSAIRPVLIFAAEIRADSTEQGILGRSKMEKYRINQRQVQLMFGVQNAFNEAIMRLYKIL
jgi:hypothetical protein